jgi:hypothetical protein
VIILDIVEDLPLRKVYQLLKVFRNSQDKAAHRTDDGPDSDLEIYNLIGDHVVTADWVGPITAHLNCQMRGERYVSRLLIPL